MMPTLTLSLVMGWFNRFKVHAYFSNVKVSFKVRLTGTERHAGVFLTFIKFEFCKTFLTEQFDVLRSICDL